MVHESLIMRYKVVGHTSSQDDICADIYQNLVKFLLDVGSDKRQHRIKLVLTSIKNDLTLAEMYTAAIDFNSDTCVRLIVQANDKTLRKCQMCQTVILSSVR